MRAVLLSALEGIDALAVVDDAAEPPPPGPDEVLIEVRACGVTFPDVLLTRGAYQIAPALPFSPGLEVAGVVAAAGEGASVGPGDHVVALLPDAGGMAERVLAPAATTFALPPELSFAEGAGLVANYHTAHFAVARRGRLRAGESVLIHGAAGGLGSACLQVAKGLGAGPTIAVVSTEEKGRFAREQGADEVVLADPDWLAPVRAAHPGGVDIVVDPVGGDRFDDAVRALARDGRLVVVGFAGGRIPELRVNRLLFRNAEVVGAAYGAYVTERPDIAAATATAVAELVRAGAIRPPVSARLPLEEAADALRSIEARAVLGKIVIDVAGEG
jgi:NADPH2:quinone reductase